MDLRAQKLACLSLGLLLMTPPLSAVAQEGDFVLMTLPLSAVEPGDEPSSPSLTERGIAGELNVLFERLSHARTPDDARIVEDAIWVRWNQSGSISVDLLLSRGVDALAKGDYERSLSFLDEVVDLAPGYPEGWNKRATVHFLREDYESAINDIETTLALEPRHFGAIGGLALMLEDLGDKEGALDAYRRVLMVYPWLDGAVEAESRLTVEVEGRGI